MTASDNHMEIRSGENCSYVAICSGNGCKVVSVRDGRICPEEEQVPDSVRLGRDARFDIVYIVLPGASCGISLRVDLDGEGAEANVSGIYLCNGQDEVRINMDVRHNVPHCNSRQLFKGLAAGASKADFYGKITVAQDAQKTEAYQENHSILLSDAARVDTKPQLEIYADDVKCSHGATVGRLNEEEQFYMRSRGIPENEAKVLQQLSFLSPVLEHIADEAVRNEAESMVESAVRNI